MRVARGILWLAVGVATACLAAPDADAQSASRSVHKQAPRSAAPAATRSQAAAQPAARARSTPQRGATATAPRLVPQATARPLGRTPSAQGRRSRASYAYASGYGGISCVPYVRAVTGMDVSGNAHAWWYNSAGLYERSSRPEVGSVMVFRASGGMRLGHVAVVSRVLGNREVLIDHANWGGPGIRRGTVMRGVRVVDASEANDWSAVRVQVGWDDDTLGRTYPLHGFIHNREDTGGTMVARAPREYEEVAEAPLPRVVTPRRGLDMTYRGR